jgi:NADPH:quinone reductase-like Zn-dependent oxidoreductase
MSTTSSKQVQLPQRMKAAVFERFGQPEEMHIAEIPVPELGEGELLIRVETAGVGSWDPVLGEGRFGADQARFPLVLGSDGAGTVVARGRAPGRFDVGDRVYAWGFLNPKGGFFAEYAVVAEEEVEAVPSGMSVAEAGVLAVDGLTALAGLDQLQLAATQSLLVLGASGGVGHLAVQLAKRLGVRVFAVASGPDGVELARRVGADAAVDGRTADVVAAVASFAPAGVDAALVLAGSESVGPLALVRRGGRIVYPNGVQPVPGAIPGVRVQAFDGYSGQEALRRLNDMIAMAPFHVEIGRTYSLQQAPRALRDVTKHHLGKLAIAVGSS